MKQIVLATQNKGKIEAASSAVEDFGHLVGLYPGSYELIPSDSLSGVPTTPIGDEQGVLGCENRIKSIIGNRGLMPDFIIAMEGIIGQVGKRHFVRGWTMMYHIPTDHSITASGASVEVPEFVAEKIDKGSEFSDLVKELYPLSDKDREDLRNIGSNGVFTMGIYGRHKTFYDGVSICLASLANRKNLKQSNN